MSSRYCLLLIAFLIAPWSTHVAFGQEKTEVPVSKEAREKEGKAVGEEPFTPHSSIGIALNHAHIFRGRDPLGKKKSIGLPAWALDYNYHISPKWAIGLHTDVIFEQYIIANHEGEEIERSRPIAPALMGVYKPGEHWSFLAGVGGEFAKEENFFLTRLGIEYGVEIRKGWEVFGTFSYDIKWKGYDSWLLGLGVSKAFGGKKSKGE
jgi:hypothetical protein